MELGAVADDPLVPIRRRRVPDEQRAPHPLDPAEHGARHALALKRSAPRTERDAVGRDRGHGIDANPPLVREPDLGPRVGVRLANDEVAADTVELAALIAGDDSRREPRGAHHHGER